MKFFSWHLTNHGHARFLERVMFLEDEEDIKKVAKEGLIMGFFRGFSFKWKEDYRQRPMMWLVTVYFVAEEDYWDDFNFLVDRPSKHTFDYESFTRRIQCQTTAMDQKH